jgi:hypothetical protein
MAIAGCADRCAFNLHMIQSRLQIEFASTAMQLTGEERSSDGQNLAQVLMGK